MGLLGEFVEVTASKSDGRLDLPAMIAKTEECVKNGTENIAEASFSYNGNYCAVDILHKTEGGYAIYEVKSTTSGKKKEEYRKYATDIAYQKWVLEKCGINVTGTYLVLLNSDYRLRGELDIQELFHIEDLKDLVENEYLKVEANASKAMAIVNPKDEPEHDLFEGCKKPYDCAFWQYCTKQKNIASPSVFDLYGTGVRFSKKLKLYNEGKVSFEDLSKEGLPDGASIQINCTLNNTEVLNRGEIRKFLNGLTYPLYFLDFETMQPVVPEFEGTKAYQQIPFQYSLHWIEKDGGELKHTEFIGESGTDPRRALAEQLCKDIPMNVCTLAYNNPFEKGRIKEMAETFPDLKEHLMNIHDDIQDLLIPFKDWNYYVPAMGGSFSIKSVLPALFPNDPELDYHKLAGVHNGGEAMDVFPKIKDMTPEKQKEAYDALWQYCRLDTLAMVKVWEKLREVGE